MKNKVIETIKKYKLIEAGDKIVLGVSGGPDSISMLNILNEIKDEFDFKIYVAHINHLIREEAIDDEKFVENYCKKNDIPFFCKRAEVQKIFDTQKIGT